MNVAEITSRKTSRSKPLFVLIPVIRAMDWPINPIIGNISD
jgi:hypothetical protein